MGRTGHPALIIGISAFAVLAVGTGVALSRGDVPIARAATVLGPVRDADVTAPDGLSRLARSGQRVPDGDVVTTGRHGDAQLLTRGRIVMLGGLAADEVIDG